MMEEEDSWSLRGSSQLGVLFAKSKEAITLISAVGAPLLLL